MSFLVQFTEAEFTGPPGRLSGDVSVDEAERALQLCQPTSEGFAFGDYRICHGKFQGGNPSTTQLLAWERDGLEVAVGLYQGVVIGLSCRNLLWVDEPHRGKGLGPQIAAELLVMLGGKTWDKAQWLKWLRTPNFTTSGLENRRRMFHVLVQREIIAEGL